jgi:hypothetical protein
LPLLGKTEIRFEVFTGDQDLLLNRLESHEVDVVLTSKSPGARFQRVQTHVLTRSPVLLVSNRRSEATPSKAGVLQGRDIFIPGSSFEAHSELETALSARFHGFRIAGQVEDIALLRILAIRSGSVVAVPEMGVRTEVATGELKVIAKLEGIEQKFYALVRNRLQSDPLMLKLIRGMAR